MADSNYSNAAEPKDLAQDDPFAELTRIMGHDTRPIPKSESAQEEPTDNLSLELENELLGDLADEADQPDVADAALDEEEVSFRQYAQAPEPDLSAEEVAEPESTLDDTFESAFDDVFAAEEPAAAEDSEAADDTHAEPSAFAEEGGAEESAGDDPFMIREEDLAALDPDFAMYDQEADAAAATGEEPQAPAQAEHDASFGEDEPVSEQPEYFSAADAAGATYSQVPEDGWIPASTPAGDDAEMPADEPQAITGGDALGEWSPEALFAGLDGQDWHQGGEHDAEPEAPAADPMPPEVDTVEVPEGAVALADNLDVPEVPYQKEEVKAEFDEIEEMLAGAFGEGNDAADGPDDAWMETAPRRTEAPQEQDDEEIDDYLTAGIGAGVGAGIAAYAAQNSGGNAYSDPAASYHDRDIREWSATSDELKPAPGAEPPAAESGRRFGSRTMMAAAVIGGVVILGGVTVFALSFGGGDAEEPALVKADDTPVKVKPENPGGTTIPNQDNQVYRRVSGETEVAEPGQTRLVSNTEEPVDLPALETPTSDPAVETPASDIAAAKVEDRLENPIEEASSGNETATLAPRRVRSFVVQPDGTMVPNDVPEPVETAGNNADEVANAVAADSETVAATQAQATDEPSAAMENAQAAATTGNTQTDADGNIAEAAAANAVSVPSSGPIPPSRPSNIATAQQQQADSSANANSQAPQAQQQGTPTQVAAAEPPPAQAAAGSDWSVQISSQASVEGAQQSYQELAQRYGNLLQGKGVNIVKADIAGKGTYYRVRIPSSSKDEAIRLCEQLKAAGGSCFVSK
ncbi:SPOR domain-containing protein [Chelativorans salis]|uniref:SPOR domain-containing protein n=1 Tax=Chelativorans salis TaxID=2978478 RepID=A0ABT2LNT1_9HYPH|nr:SPOR domain-containing protein [Chelativorans sp. EGI FJ00035]MCT7375328.1 SPOR domain-containing protein [Chelativorans sp. EGI FJ00035]